VKGQVFCLGGGFPSGLFFVRLSASLAFLTCFVPVIICFFFLLGLFEIDFLLDSIGDLCWWRSKAYQIAKQPNRVLIHNLLGLCNNLISSIDFIPHKYPSVLIAFTTNTLPLPAPIAFALAMPISHAISISISIPQAHRDIYHKHTQHKLTKKKSETK